MTTVEQEAVNILGRMESIVRNEMLTRGVYVTDHIVDPELAEQGAICGGRQACMVGSMWLAAGYLTLPGVTIVEERQEFLAERPALAMAYDAMNSVSHDYIIDQDLHHWRWEDRYPIEGWMEALFEATTSATSNYGGCRAIVETKDLLHLIDQARTLIKSRVSTDV